MRKLFMQIRTASMAALMGMALAVPAGAGTLYKWVEADGTVAFTDDAKRIPERYKGAAEKRTVNGLDDYARYSKVDTAAADRQAEQLHARLARLEELNRQLWGWDQPTVAAAGAGSHNCGGGNAGQALVQVGPRTALGVPIGAGGEGGPTIVDEIRMVPEGGITSRTNTIIRQGGEVKMVVRPRHYSNGFPDEEDYVQ